MNRPRRFVIAIFAMCAAYCCARPVPRVSPSSLDEARRLDQQVEQLYEQGKYQEALAPALRALALREKALGPRHLEVANSLNDVAMVHQARGAYSEAEPRYLRALDIREQALGVGHPNVAAILNNLASLYQAQGAYIRAEPLYLRALDIRTKALGPDHPQLATTLNNLAENYRTQAMYSKAEPLYLRALDLYKKALGPGHRHVANTLNNLAMLYVEQGAYAKAEPLYLRAVAIIEKALGPRHPLFATSLSNLAMLYREQGAYAKAEPLYLRALSLMENALGPTHRDVAAVLVNLAGLYREEGEHVRAEALYHRVLEIHARALGSMHPQFATSLNNLAELYLKTGAYDKALPLLVRALDVREKSLGPTHPDVAASLSNLAKVYRARGAYGEAEQLHARALQIREASLGAAHPLVATSLNELAALYRAQGAFTRAVPLLLRAADIQEQRLRTELAPLSEPRKRAWMALLQEETDSVVSLHADAMPGSPEAVDLALTTVLRRKGRILDSLVDGQSRVRGNPTRALRDQLDQLAQARTELARQLYEQARSQAPTNLTAVAATRARIDELESVVSADGAAVRVDEAPVTVAGIQAVLPAGAALVEFVRYQRLDARRVRPEQTEQDARYLAYVLTAHGPPRWVPLGEAAKLDGQIDAVLGAVGGPAASQVTRAALQRLDALVLAPLRDSLSGISHLVLAPDGKLNLVPFEALVDSDGRYALERYLMSYVTTGRDLLRLAAPRQPGSPAIIVADPDYGPLLRPGQPGMWFDPLPGARAEAADLRAYFAAAPLMGEQATKSALAAQVAPAIVHIVTHGFYAAGGPASPLQQEARRITQREPRRGMFVDGGGAFPGSWLRSDELADALDRSGLAMAGANRSADGIVTAREIAGFDWWGTQLVVVSACQTGVGAVSTGDGVYGMRRALVLAGTASQVVSLWNVDDTATRALMRDFYGELARGTGRAEALRQAKLRLLHEPPYEHPYYWAAFIPAGDWRPLDHSVFSVRNPQP